MSDETASDPVEPEIPEQWEGMTAPDVAEAEDETSDAEPDEPEDSDDAESDEPEEMLDAEPRRFTDPDSVAE